jgi:hypothetical protein
VLIEKKRVLEGFSKIRSNFSDELQIVPVGSKPEGYGIPDAVRLDENPSIEYLSDIDAMLVREELRAAEREFKPDGSKRHRIFVMRRNCWALLNILQLVTWTLP